MSSVDAFIVRELVGRVDWAIQKIESAISHDKETNDDHDDNVERPSLVDNLEPEVMVAEFLMMTRAVPTSTCLDSHFVRLYRHLALLTKTERFNKASLHLFAHEYSIETRMARLKALKVEVTAVEHALEVARQAEDDTLTTHESDGNIKSAEDVEWATRVRVRVRVREERKRERSERERD